jgi:uncharacterized lipoprotein YbaY
MWLNRSRWWIAAVNLQGAAFLLTVSGLALAQVDPQWVQEISQRGRTLDQPAAGQDNWLFDQLGMLNEAMPNYSGASVDGARGSAFAPSNWRLGAFVELPVEGGAMIRDVEPGSAAQRAGLRAGDTIVNVAGYQVGYVGDRLYDLGDEIRKRADASGRVSLLVLDGQARRLRAVPVEIRQVGRALSGQLTLPDRQAAPPGSVMTVELVNTTRPFQMIAGGRQQLMIQGLGPFRFEMTPDTAYLDRNDRYEVRATISSGGEVQFAGSRPLRDVMQAGSLDIPMIARAATASGGGIPGQLTSTSGGSVSAGFGSDTSRITDYYRRYLGRDPRPLELSEWSRYIASGSAPQPWTEFQVQLLGSSEFYERSGNSPGGFVTRLYQQVTGRAPSSQELKSWQDRLQRLAGNRATLAREFLQAAA